MIVPTSASSLPDGYPVTGRALRSYRLISYNGTLAVEMRL